MGRLYDEAYYMQTPDEDPNEGAFSEFLERVKSSTTEAVEKWVGNVMATSPSEKSRDYKKALYKSLQDKKEIIAYLKASIETFNYNVIIIAIEDIIAANKTEELENNE